MDLQPAIWIAWQTGPHGAVYDLGKGPNTYCAQCHSPLEWDSNARIDPPPNCVSCKFATDSAVRVAAGNPLISESDWHGIQCQVCHRIENAKKADSQLAWYNAASGFYETVLDSTQLCNKCHRDTEALRYAVSLGDQVHSGFTCTQCHDPHNLVATCTQSGCHTGLVGESRISPHATGADVGTCNSTGCHDNDTMTGRPTPVISKDGWNHRSLTHSKVSCEACHDASGMEVGPLEGSDRWGTIRKVTLLGRTTEKPYPSHDLQREVDCARCHFPANPWGMVEGVNWK